MIKRIIAVILSITLIYNQSAFAVEKVTYYYNDYKGSVVAAADESGSLLWKEQFLPYGEKTIGQIESGNDSRYATHSFDAETGLVYMGARWYNPETGQFLTPDPLGVDIANGWTSFNPYTYSNNNPNKYVDPDGRLSIILVAITAILASVIIATTVANSSRHGTESIEINSNRESIFSLRAGEIFLDEAVSESETEKSAPDVTKGKTHGHHSDPKFMGGDKKQPLTNLEEQVHKDLHKDLNDYLKNKTDSFGNHMRPQRGNSGQKIRQNFTRQERLEALRDFYRGPGAKYKDAANDFFNQHPGL